MTERTIFRVDGVCAFENCAGCCEHIGAETVLRVNRMNHADNGIFGVADGEWKRLITDVQVGFLLKVRRGALYGDSFWMYFGGGAWGMIPAQDGECVALVIS